MHEPRNGLAAVLRAWPIILAVGSLILGLIGWQFLGLKATVDTLVHEHAQSLTAVRQVAGLQEEMKQLRIEVATKATPVAILETRLTSIDREMQSMRIMLEKIREDLMRGRRFAPGPEPF